MNLYLVFALALGAISGTATTTVVAPVASVVAARAERAIVRGPALAVRVEPNRLKPVLHRIAFALFGEVPLTGAATPRAPAHNC